MNASDFMLVVDLHEKMYGHRPAVNTVSRWITTGRKVRGVRRTLRIARIGNRPHTTAEWLRAFKEDELPPLAEIDRGPTNKQLQRAQQAAESFLAAEGV